MSAWDPWWVHGDYAETYHGAPDEEEDEPCETCGGSGKEAPTEAWPHGRPCPDCAITEEEWLALQDYQRRDEPMTDKSYRIYMDETRTGDGGFSPYATLGGGWYGHVPLVGMNEPIYCRVPDKQKAWTFTADEAARHIEDMRGLGYPCHADPPLTITRSY